MNLGVIWGNVWSAVQTAGQNVLTAAETSAVQGVNQVRTAAGGALQTTGIGLGAAVAPPDSAPAALGWAAEHWPYLVAGGIILAALLIRGGGK